ncbi:hypothetical protein [Micromonospora sp. NPDC005174]|uniref:hypothetical protein n=1 Tax=Micromonospora sp. NPDC005174 TaxID=3157018 RepID=UPI0033B3D299
MPVKVKFRADRAGIARMLRQEWMYRELERRADRVIVRARVTAPVRSYEYRSRIGRERVESARTATVRVVARADHSLILEQGSRPHIIEPRRKQALAWPGVAHPVKRVHHPGTPAMHILRNALIAGAGD